MAYASNVGRRNCSATQASKARPESRARIGELKLPPTGDIPNYPQLLRVTLVSVRSGLYYAENVEGRGLSSR